MSAEENAPDCPEKPDNAEKPEKPGKPETPEKPAAAPPRGFFGMLAWALSNERAGALQFFKYASVGGFCTLLNIVITIALSTTCLLCLTAEESHKEMFGIVTIDLPHVPAGFPEWRRLTYFAIASGIGFVVSNVACWLLDRWLVFTPGRHKAGRELLYFIGVSAIALAVGQLAQWLLMSQAGASAWVAFAANIASALCINFATRKLFVFKR